MNMFVHKSAQSIIIKSWRTYMQLATRNWQVCYGINDIFQKIENLKNYPYPYPLR